MITEFQEKVYSLLKKVPKGRVTTYKSIAKKIGIRGYRAVGNALNKNPHPVIVPCHRVVCSDGRIGGFSRGVKEKIRLLKKEDIIVRNGKVIDFNQKIYKL